MDVKADLDRKNASFSPSDSFEIENNFGSKVPFYIPRHTYKLFFFIKKKKKNLKISAIFLSYIDKTCYPNFTIAKNSVLSFKWLSQIK